MMNLANDAVKTIEEIIEVVKEHNASSCAWIFDNGRLKDNVVSIDTIAVLRDLRNIEADADTRQFVIDAINEGEEPISSEYTYNWNAPVSNDIVFQTYRINGERYTLICVHIGLDARVGFTDWCIIEGGIEEIAELCMYYTVDITETLSADLNLFSETYDVYDFTTGEDVYTSYEIDKNELLDAMRRDGVI